MTVDPVMMLQVDYQSTPPFHAVVSDLFHAEEEAGPQTVNIFALGKRSNPETRPLLLLPR
jgi:hypothetical protein